MALPHYSPATGRFERRTSASSTQHQHGRSDSIDSSDFGAFVDALADQPHHAQGGAVAPADIAEAAAAAAAGVGPVANDEDLFHAFERAAIEQAHHRPSPPPIDLRSVENKLGKDIVMPRRTSSSSHSASGPAPAQHSPSITRLDSSIEALAPSSQPHQGGGATSAFSFFDLDLLDPHHANPDRPSIDPALLEDDPALLKEQLSLKRRQNSVAHARDYSGAGSSAFSLGSSAGGSSSQHADKHGLRGGIVPGPTPISGAPGFDARAERNWNTGHWKFDLEHDPVVGPGTSPLSASFASLPPVTTSASAGAGTSRAATIPTDSSSSLGHDSSQQRGQARSRIVATSSSQDHHHRPANPQLVIRRPISVTLTDRHELTSEVILPWHASHLQAALPPRLRLGRTWKLLYSLDQHGMSLATLYNNVAKGLDPARAGRGSGGGAGNGNAELGDSYMRGASAAARGAVGLSGGAGGSGTGGLRKVGGGLSITEAGLILAVKDADDNVFGAFINERLRPKPGYYGSGECFLWKTTRQPPSLLAVNPALEPNRIKTFRWTGRNDYVLLTEASFLSVGSGDNGRYGLWLDSSLENGVSSRCSTFANDVLCNDEPGGDEQDGGGDLAIQQFEEEERKRAERDPFGLLDGGGVDDDGGEAKFEIMGLELWAVGID